MTSVFVAHALASDLSGRPLDFTLPLARAAHAATNVPMPGLPPAKRPQAAAAKKTK